MVIIEAGANDCQDTLRLEREYPDAKVYTFECNPKTVERCRKAVAGHPNILLTEKALSDTIGSIKFFPTNLDTKTPHPDGNPGASSMFKASPEYPYEEYHQDEVSVDSTTLDEFCKQHEITTIDYMWLDAKGAELKILKGCKIPIKKLHTEVNFKEQYLGQPLFEEVKSYLESRGMRFVGFGDKYDWFGDANFELNES
jgi:FkbM family methyltransferase